MIELRELKRQVDHEIRKEQREGKLEFTKPVSDLSISKPQIQVKNKPIKNLNIKPSSTATTTSALNYTSLRRKLDPDNPDPFNLEDGTLKAKGGGSYSTANVNTSKI